MKKTVRLSLCVTVLALLLSACAGKNGLPDAGTTVPMVAPTVSPTTSTVAPTASSVQMSEEEKIEKLLNGYWYQRALSCTFEKAEEISIEFYLYSGLHPDDRQNKNSYTDDEKAYLDNEWRGKYGENAWASASKMPVAKINEALSILGVTIKDVEIPVKWVYYDKTDSYYVWVRDAFGIVDWNVTDVVKNTEGITKVYWEIKDMHLNTATGDIWDDGVKMVMTLQEKADGTYLVLSNVPQK